MGDERDDMPARREITRVVEPDFTGVIYEHANGMELALIGTADQQTAPPFQRILALVQTELTRVQAREAIIDLRQLEFMNSSSFKVFVSWISDLHELPAEQRYQMRFLSNPEFHWQKRSLGALRHFAVDLITIEVS